MKDVPPKKLEDISRETLLRSAHWHAADRHKKGRPLWAFVRDVCSVGSTSAFDICREIGWNPDANASMTLPPRKA